MSFRSRLRLHTVAVAALVSVACGGDDAASPPATGTDVTASDATAAVDLGQLADLATDGVAAEDAGDAPGLAADLPTSPEDATTPPEDAILEDAATPDDAATLDDAATDTSDPTEPVAPLEFVCGDGVRLPLSWVCDGFGDCEDDSDEAAPACTRFACEARGESSIPSAWRCDGDNDCDDASDEAGCVPFVCEDGTSMPSATVCNGDAECADASDERVPGCTSFFCDGGRTVLPITYVCDRDPDCDDGADEADCATSP